MSYRVYDDRTNETIYTNESELACVKFIIEHFPEDDEESQHIWVEEIK